MHLHLLAGSLVLMLGPASLSIIPRQTPVILVDEIRGSRYALLRKGRAKAVGKARWDVKRMLLYEASQQSVAVLSPVRAQMVCIPAWTGIVKEGVTDRLM